MTPTIVRGGIALPCSSPRKSPDKFMKLLRHVDPDADHGFGFEGVFLRPGSTVTWAELRPTLEFPATPIVLEHGRAPATGPAGHRRAASLYILWRYQGNAWHELGRAASMSWHWAMELRPLALRALQEARGGLVLAARADLPAIATRIAVAIDSELRALDAPERRKVIGVIHDQFAARIVA